MISKNKILLPVTVISAIFLAACGDKTEDKLQKVVDQNKPTLIFVEDYAPDLFTLPREKADDISSNNIPFIENSSIPFIKNIFVKDSSNFEIKSVVGQQNIEMAYTGCKVNNSYQYELPTQENYSKLNWVSAYGVKVTKFPFDQYTDYVKNFNEFNVEACKQIRNYLVKNFLK